MLHHAFCLLAWSNFFLLILVKAPFKLINLSMPAASDVIPKAKDYAASPLHEPNVRKVGSRNTRSGSF